MAHSTPAEVVNVAEQAKEKAAQFASEALKKTAESAGYLAAKTEETIAENPYKSVLVAFGVGALLGVLLSRR